MDHYQALNIRQFFLNGQKLTDEWGKKGIYHFEYTPGEPLKYITDQGTVLWLTDRGGQGTVLPSRQKKTRNRPLSFLEEYIMDFSLQEKKDYLLKYMAYYIEDYFEQLLNDSKTQPEYSAVTVTNLCDVILMLWNHMEKNAHMTI